MKKLKVPSKHEDPPKKIPRKSIALPLEDHEKLRALADRHNASIVATVKAMTEYFMEADDEHED